MNAMMIGICLWGAIMFGIAFAVGKLDGKRSMPTPAVNERVADHRCGAIVTGQVTTPGSIDTEPSQVAQCMLWSGHQGPHEVMAKDGRAVISWDNAFSVSLYGPLPTGLDERAYVRAEGPKP